MPLVRSLLTMCDGRDWRDGLIWYRANKQEKPAGPRAGRALFRHFAVKVGRSIFCLTGEGSMFIL